MKTRRWAAAVLSMMAMSAVGCGGTPGAPPTDMSAAEHEAAARQHDDQATTHSASFDAGATVASTECTGKGRTGPCWTLSRNPTAGHATQADEQRKMAADHRAASKSLRDAEASACAGLSDTDRDASPFEHRGDLTAVDELHGHAALSPKQASSIGPLEGASVTIRAVPGLTKEYLQRLVTCHSARNATMGTMPEMAYCPLAVKGATATVESAGASFRVDIRGNTKQSSEEILHRSKALTSVN